MKTIKQVILTSTSLLLLASCVQKKENLGDSQFSEMEKRFNQKIKMNYVRKEEAKLLPSVKNQMLLYEDETDLVFNDLSDFRQKILNYKKEYKKEKKAEEQKLKKKRLLAFKRKVKREKIREQREKQKIINIFY